jgi:hypothetical protein
MFVNLVNIDLLHNFNFFNIFRKSCFSYNFVLKLSHIDILKYNPAFMSLHFKRHKLNIKLGSLSFFNSYLFFQNKECSRNGIVQFIKNRLNFFFLFLFNNFRSNSLHLINYLNSKISIIGL